jgi:peptidoglycan/LPS O-acetylase OafA/YrhL
MKIHFSALNGLRGFAVLIVFFSHISNDNMHIFPNLDFSGIGKSGVYLFFILS